MNSILLGFIATAALLATAWASPADDDISTCMKNGNQSRATCIHSVMP